MTILPRSSTTDTIGTSTREWLNGFFKSFDISGVLEVGDHIDVAVDQDSTSTIGHVVFGSTIGSAPDYATLGHNDTSYMISQGSAGDTWINSMLGQIVRIVEGSAETGGGIIMTLGKDNGDTQLNTSLKIDTDSTTGLFVEDNGSKDNTFIVDTHNGRVGVNKAPSVALDVFGTASSSALMVSGNATSSSLFVGPTSNAYGLRIDNLSALGGSVVVPVINSTYSYLGSQIVGGTIIDRGIILRETVGALGSDDPTINFYDQTLAGENSAIRWNTTTDQMSFSYASQYNFDNKIYNSYTTQLDGLVGINMEPAGYNLGVNGTGYYSGDLTVGGGESITGNLGIGQAYSTTKLSVLSTTDQTYDPATAPSPLATFYNQDPSGYASIRLQTQASGGSLQKQGAITVIDGDGANTRNSSMAFGLRDNTATVINEKMRLTYDGYLGIGTTTPQSTLTIGSTENGTRQYAQIDSEAGSPPAGDCDSILEAGRTVVDSTNDRLYVCNQGSGRGWDYVSLTD